MCSGLIELVLDIIEDVVPRMTAYADGSKPHFDAVGSEHVVRWNATLPETDRDCVAPWVAWLKQLVLAAQGDYETLEAWDTRLDKLVIKVQRYGGVVSWKGADRSFKICIRMLELSPRSKVKKTRTQERTIVDVKTVPKKNDHVI